MLLSLIYFLICRALSAGHGSMDDRVSNCSCSATS
jgi:hypothetical protein